MSGRIAIPDGAYSHATSAQSRVGRVARACTGFTTPAAVDLCLAEIRKAQADLTALHRALRPLRPRQRTGTRKD